MAVYTIGLVYLPIPALFFFKFQKLHFWSNRHVLMNLLHTQWVYWDHTLTQSKFIHITDAPASVLLPKPDQHRRCLFLSGLVDARIVSKGVLFDRYERKHREQPCCIHSFMLFIAQLPNIGHIRAVTSLPCHIVSPQNESP